MHLLRFLEDASGLGQREIADTVTVEYRLACSGELYNRKVLTTDWRKSDATRVLPKGPLELFVASQPFASYPQQLCARLALAYITESESAGNVSGMRIFLPDEDIVEDLCSVLSLLSRRLISVVSKTREQHSNACSALGSYGSDTPIPILPAPRIAVWAERPATVLTSLEGQKIIDNTPPPVGVDPGALAEVLLKLASIPGAKEILYASRLYRTALELIESRPDISYLLLISTVESLAALALVDYEPEDSAKLASTLPVQQRARDFGLDEESVRLLALDACGGQRWLRKKFKKFLLDFATPDRFFEKDQVFLVPEYLCPPADAFSTTLGRIYDMRSGNLHAASPFPRHVAVGTGPRIRLRDLPVNPLERAAIPPVAWFERVVSLADREFLLGRVSASSAPFVEYGA